MVDTPHLFKLADDLKIEWTSYLPNDVFGLYVKQPKTRPAVGLNKQLLTMERELRGVLAEEIGHHKTAVGSLTYTTPCRNRPYLFRHEQRAVSWATELLVPTDKYIELLMKGYRRDEIADYFYVTEVFLRWKEELLKERGKDKCLG